MTSPLAETVQTRFTDDANRIFIVDATGTEVTYGELARRATAAVQAFEAAGVTRGDRVGILMPHGLDFAILYFACLLGGLTAVPINSALPIKDLAFIIPRSGLKTIIAHGGLAALQAAVGRAELPEAVTQATLSPENILTDRIVVDDEVGALLRKLDLDALFSIHFTSGTTSLPKGVPHRVASLLGNAAAFNATFGVDAQCRMLHVMPMAYMAGFLNTLLVPFMAGGQVILVREFSGQIVPHFWTPVIAHSANMIWASPSMLTILNKIDRDPRGPAYCEAHTFRVFSATAPLPMKVRSAFEHKYGTPVIESYGLSELLLLTANAGICGAKPQAVGPAITDVQLEIRDTSGVAQPVGVDGEVFVQTPFVALGYLDYETGGSTASHATWFDSGDLGHLDEDGYLFITGRKKDLIIRGGFNVSPRVIEELLLQHSAIEGAAVIGAPNEFYGEEIVAVIQIRSGSNLPDVTTDLRHICQTQLGAQMVPDRIVAVDAFPTSVTGKVQKNILRDQLMRGGSP